MRWSWKLNLRVCLAGGASAFAGDHFRVKARLLPGAPARASYPQNEAVSRGAYTAMLEAEEVVEDLNLIRRTQNPALDAKATTKVFRKVFHATTRDVATTAEIRSVDAAPVRLNDIRLAAYSDGRFLFTGRIQELPKNGSANSTIKERTDGCRVTIRVRGYSSTEVASTAVSPNGPMLFECVQSFWMSKLDDCAISLVCPEELQLCRSHYQELTHLQVEVETRRNR